MDRKIAGILIVMCAGALAACGKSQQNQQQAPSPQAPAAPTQAPPPQAAAAQQAEATLKATEGNKAAGTVTFMQMGGGVHVVADISGLTPGKHGFHVHEKGDCSAPDGSSAGGHFNPTNAQHGAPDAPSHHAGDLGNITADDSGHAALDQMFQGLSLSGPDSIVGKGLIVHGGEDDLKSQPAGNAGPRVACGVIEAGEAGQ